jgi:hypothetical protein
VSQAQVSRIENQADLYLSTLRSYIAAMGGELQLRAVFPDGQAAIISADELLEPAEVVGRSGHGIRLLIEAREITKARETPSVLRPSSSSRAPHRG